MPNSDNSELNEVMAASREVESLLQHPGFIWVLEMLESGKQEAAVALHTVDPTDTKEITRLQNEIWRHDETVAILRRLLEAGAAAREELSS